MLKFSSSLSSYCSERKRNDINEESDDKEADFDPNDTLQSRILIPEKEKEPDLHSLGSMFLNKWMRILFDIAVMVNLVSLLINYTLAGAESYGELLNVDYMFLIFPIAILFSVVVVFGSNVLHFTISGATFLKGTLLLVVVCVTTYIGFRINLTTDTDWRYIGKPFLISTITLGGAINILPVTFGKIKPNRQDIIKYMCATIGGLTTVWLLNLIWAYYILKIVPQKGEISLYASEVAGELSTKPLIQMIAKTSNSFSWLAILIDVFIVATITVSFLTIGTALKHVLDGFVFSLTVKLKGVEDKLFENMKNFILDLHIYWKKAIIYVIFFGLVWIIAQILPKGFFSILRHVISLSLNLSSGIFICVMIDTARRCYSTKIPVPLYRWIFHLRIIVFLYFIIVIVGDIVSWVLELINNQQQSLI